MMATNKIPQVVLENLLETILNSNDIDVLREVAQWILQQLVEADVSTKIGAQRYEQTEKRNNQRNGIRERSLDTRVGRLNLAIPKLRKGSYFPEWLLDRRKPAEQAVMSIVMEAYINGLVQEK